MLDPVIMTYEDWCREHGSHGRSGFVVEELSRSMAEAFPNSNPRELELGMGREHQAGHIYLVAAFGPRIVGGVSGYRYWQPRHRIWEINHIWVSHGACAGLADRLMEAMLEHAHQVFRDAGFSGARVVFLFTHEVPKPAPSDRLQVLQYRLNRSAHRLYERWGFQRFPFLPDFARPGVPELVYARWFPEHE